MYYTERKLKNKKTGEAWEQGYPNAEKEGVLPRDQLPLNQLPIDQFPPGQLPLNQLPTKPTVNLCMNTCTNEQVHYTVLAITKVQFGVSLKLDTLQD